MKARRHNDEVLYTDEPNTRVCPSDIEQLKARARTNPRGRIRLCAHPNVTDAVHEMLIVHTRECYVRPHRHVNRPESYHVIEGAATLVTFEEDGQIREIIPIGDRTSGRIFYVRLADTGYHTLAIESELLVFHETTRGPFDPKTTVHAPWSPEESDRRGVEEFMARFRALVLGSDENLPWAPSNTSIQR